MKRHLTPDPRLVDTVVAAAIETREAWRVQDDISMLLSALAYLFVSDHAKVSIVKRWQRHYERAERTTWLAVVTDPHGEELARYPISRHEPIECWHWANLFATGQDMVVDESGGDIPCGGGDIEVAIYDTASMTVGGVHRWNTQRFFLKGD